MKTHRATNRRIRRGRAAFTLVELLVVVSIIALLISILLPSLRKAREQTKSAVCIAGLKSISTASIVYASDDRVESAVPVHPEVLNLAVDASLRRATMVYAYGGKSGAGKEGTDVLFWGTGRKRGPATRPLNKFLYKSGFIDFYSNPGLGGANWNNDKKLNLDQFRCPSDKGYQGNHYTAWRDSKLTSYDHYGNSYAASLLWIYVPGGMCAPGVAAGGCCSLAPALRPLSRVPNPSNTLYYEENVGRYTFTNEPDPPVDPDYTACGAPTPGVVNGWHGRPWYFNVSFADASARQIKLKGYFAPRLADYPDCGGWADCFMYWRCVIIRGQGYQRDVLPSPPVATDIACQ